MNANLVVRSVEIYVSCSSPQMNRYTIHFANDWADALAIKASSIVPPDVWLPLQPQAIEPLANLLTLSASSINANTIQVNAGVAPPAGGGFEVRRRDWSFGPGTDSDLVLRSPISNSRFRVRPQWNSTTRGCTTDQRRRITHAFPAQCLSTYHSRRSSGTRVHR